ncbi:MAG: hypothetical protein LBT79_03295 [Elusimicrobiota bacterium]|jgi:DNA-binding phage protein|nr:hypothetical protein [Elusimicrobiota bacterium]
MKKNKITDYPKYEDLMLKHYSVDEIRQLKAAIIDEFNESGEISFDDLFNALKEIMRLEGMSKVAKEMNLSRENLYATTNPTIKTVSKIVEHMGYKIQLVPIH